MYKRISGFENYEININGDVRKYSTQRSLRPFLNGSGYFIINLSKDGKAKAMFFHKEIARAFLDNPNMYTQINHIDANKTNNDISNLEWCTPSQNTKHAISMGLYDPIKNLQFAWKAIRK